MLLLLAATSKERQGEEEIVFDGHLKVAATCIPNPTAHAGGPCKDKQPRSRQNTSTHTGLEGMLRGAMAKWRLTMRLS